MGDITVDHFCRLCLKEGFPLSDIYSYRSSLREPVYKILNFIYDLEIYQNDGLSSKICAPCLWRMIEFEAYKKNVHCAKVEMLKLISSLRNDSDEVSCDESNEELGTEAGDMVQDEANKAPEQVNEIHMEFDEAIVKDEIEIEEWTMPEELFIRPEEAEREISESGVVIIENRMMLCQDEMKISQEVEASRSTQNSLENSLIVVDPLSISASEGKEETEKDNTFCDILNIQFVDEEFLINNGCAYMLDESSTEDKVIEELNKSQSIKTTTCTKRRGFVCDICRKCFPGKRDIRDHVRVHYDDRPFICEYCGKGFKQSFTRTVHELKHKKQEKLTKNSRIKNTSEKCFTCSTCGNQYDNRHSFYEHSIKHTNKFSCHLCGKSFSNKTNLKSHVGIHSTERPFVCKFCQSSFNRKSNMLRHLARHTEVKVFDCTKCVKKFKTKDDLDRHKLFHLQ